MKRMFQWLMAAMLLFCGTSVFTACSSDDNPADSPANPVETEKADYAILFYGYGGGNLDYDILNNIKQFYAADSAAYDKVKIAVQYKFSNQEEFEQQLNYDPDDYDDPQEKADVVEYLEEMKSWIAKWQNRCRFTFRFTVDPKKTVEQQMVADNVHGCNNDHIANADSLLAFIDWAAKACPAKHYVLLLSDHGAGYLPNEDLPYTPSNTTRSFLIDYNKSEMLTVNALRTSRYSQKALSHDNAFSYFNTLNVING